MNFRVECDSIGEKQIPDECYYGIQTARAAENFQITGLKMNDEFINSIVQIKKAAAIRNYEAGLMSHEIANAISEACDEIISGELHGQFIVDPIQGGAGTSANMNANEVIANRSIEILGGKKGDYSLVNPNDQVNMSQSTNDVFPTAAKITALKMIQDTIVKLRHLDDTIGTKAVEFESVVKMGRTQLQDAVPVMLGQEFNAYYSVLKRDIERLDAAKEKLRIVNMGGTAIGTGVNTNDRYFEKIVSAISVVTGIKLTQAEDLIDATQNLDVFLLISSVIKICAVDLSKIANDLRLMSSGPKTGFNEIILPARQNGSSIMPGKVNPVIPEVVNQIAFNIIGNDITITMAAEAGQLELNAFEPVVFYKLFESILTLKNGSETFAKNCIAGIKANRGRCKDLVKSSVGNVTAISPYIGYANATKIAKESIFTGKSIKEIIVREGLCKNQDIDSILDPVKMTSKHKTPLKKA